MEVQVGGIEIVVKAGCLDKRGMEVSVSKGEKGDHGGKEPKEEAAAEVVVMAPQTGMGSAELEGTVLIIPDGKKKEPEVEDVGPGDGGICTKGGT